MSQSLFYSSSSALQPPLDFRLRYPGRCFRARQDVLEIIAGWVLKLWVRAPRQAGSHF